MARTALLLLLFTSTGLALFQSEQAKTPPIPHAVPPFVIPEEASKRANPIKADAESVAQGKKYYGTECSLCHGDDGSGKTSLSESMQLKLPDLRDPATTKDRTDGALFYIMLKGKGKMPPEEGRLRDAQVWHVVNYLRSIIKKEAEPEKSEKK